jgi:hypothetical protein
MFRDALPCLRKMVTTMIGSAERRSKAWSAAIVVGLVAVAAASRVIPHPWNFTPMVGLALLSGAGLRHALTSSLLTVGAVAAGDVALRQFPYEGMEWVYGSMVLISLGGRWFRGPQRLFRPIVAGLGSGFVFFAVTNFGVWLTSGMYQRTASGFAACFTAAVPFYRNQFLADGLFTSLERLALRGSASPTPTLK